MAVRKIDKKTEELFFDYCSALVQLNGRVPVLDVFDIIQRQNNGQYNLTDFLEYIEKTQRERYKFGRSESTFFVLISRYGSSDTIQKELVNDCYESDHYDADEDNSLNHLVSEQDGFPMYSPPHQELLRYAVDGYFEASPELNVLAEWVLWHQRKLKYSLTREDIIAEVCLPIQMYSDYYESIASLLKWIDLPEDEIKRIKLLNKLSRLVMAAFCGIRQWALRGYSPNEIGEILNEELQ